MSSLAYVLVAVGFSVACSLVVWFRRNRPRSMEFGIDEFQRELRALAPERRDQSAP
ncbi:MAG TPA: hypothetical protein VM264_03650 [Acidimicrobiales bacterium]|nr:hypothetical protein [Acidimicrobiales bacterium]